VKVVLYALTAAALIYALLCALLFLAQDRLLYLPARETSRPGARAVRLKHTDATLKVWELHPHQGPALIYFGGNAEDVSASLADFDAGLPDRAVYLVNYRGYGGSSGTPSEAALIADAVASYDWVAARHGRVAVLGRSLGSGVAIALAAQRPIDRLILVTPYDSITNVAADHFPWFPVRWLLRDRYDSLERIGRLHAPTLVVLAERDEVVFRARSAALLAAMPAHLARSVLIAGATHNDVSQSPDYWRSLRDFLAAAPAVAAGP